MKKSPTSKGGAKGRRAGSANRATRSAAAPKRTRSKRRSNRPDPAVARIKAVTKKLARAVNRAKALAKPAQD